MSTLVGIVGSSGTGKSTSIENLDSKQTVIINTASKPLPFRGWKTNYKEGKLSEGNNYICTSDSATMVAALKYISESRKDIKYVILEDLQYLMGFEFMNRAKEKSFDKFNDIGQNMFNVLNTARLLRDDLIIYTMYHDEIINENFTPKRKIKTIGNLLDSKITIEGLFTIILFTEVKMEDKKPHYYFVTQTDGVTSAKSPKGLFEDLLIPNDLKFVSDKIEEYYK